MPRKHTDSSTIIPCGHPTCKRFKNITGQKFGFLLANSLAGKRKVKHGSVYFWNCVCDCGALTIVSLGSLRNGTTVSCGCFAASQLSARAKTHGLSQTSEYGIWNKMLCRCTNQHDDAYKDYGARGITVCDSWLKVENFISDMGKRPSPELTLERRDNNLGYSKENCYWGTSAQQARNRRSNRHLTFQGQTMLMIEWCEKLHFSIKVISLRLKYGWSVERALTEPVGAYYKTKFATQQQLTEPPVLANSAS